MTAKAQAQYKAAIVPASLSLQPSRAPLAQLLKSALSGRHEALKQQCGAHAMQNALAQDYTPQARASRIVTLSRAFYDGCQQQHPGEHADALLRNGMDALKKGLVQDGLTVLTVLNGGAPRISTRARR